MLKRLLLGTVPVAFPLTVVLFLRGKSECGGFGGREGIRIQSNYPSYESKMVQAEFVQRWFSLDTRRHFLGM